MTDLSEELKELQRQKKDLEIRKRQGRITKQAYEVQLKQLTEKEKILRG